MVGKSLHTRAMLASELACRTSSMAALAKGTYGELTGRTGPVALRVRHPESWASKSLGYANFQWFHSTLICVFLHYGSVCGWTSN